MQKKKTLKCSLFLFFLFFKDDVMEVQPSGKASHL